MSHLVRGVWIEIYIYLNQKNSDSVAPRERCVDWNFAYLFFLLIWIKSHLVRGVWIEITILLSYYLTILSHLVRGVWIEIFFFWLWRPLKKSRTSWEVCGLKCEKITLVTRDIESHLVRGVWIEIRHKAQSTHICRVAPRERCVDWNTNFYIIEIFYCVSHLVRGVWIEIMR